MLPALHACHARRVCVSKQIFAFNIICREKLLRIKNLGHSVENELESWVNISAVWMARLKAILTPNKKLLRIFMSFKCNDARQEMGRDKDNTDKHHTPENQNYLNNYTEKSVSVCEVSCSAFTYHLILLRRSTESSYVMAYRWKTVQDNNTKKKQKKNIEWLHVDIECREDPEHQQQQQQRIATNSLCKNRKTKFSTNGKSNRCLTEIGWGCFASWSSKQQQQRRETRTTAPYNPSTLSLDHHSPSSSMQTTLERQQPATSAPQTRHNNNNKKQQNTLKGDTSSIRPAFHQTHSFLLFSAMPVPESRRSRLFLCGSC